MSYQRDVVNAVATFLIHRANIDASNVAGSTCGSLSKSYQRDVAYAVATILIH